MKRIEERAERSRATRQREQISNNASADKFMADVYVSGYINGATEQHQIDIEKAVEWLKENIRNYIFRNKGRDESGKGIWNYDYMFIDANLYDDFKKAMEL